MQVLDWAVLLAYTGALIVIGWRASRGQQTAERHLRAGRNLPAWAVVFSVLATEISAATYVGVPEMGYAGGWDYLQYSIGSLLGKIVLAWGLIRLYWRLDLPTAYGLLRRRIGPRTQASSAWAFLAGRLIASGVRLYIAALAFSVVTGLSIAWAIAAMAALSTAYTWLGGLRAVVWTDVAQGSIFVLGAAAALAFGLHASGLSPLELFREASAAGKLEVITMDDQGRGLFASLKPLPVAVLGAFFLVMASHGTDQENVQHLLNTRSERSAMRSIVTSGLFTFPVVALFLAVGTMLWAYHQRVAVSAYDPGDKKLIFPNFIMHVLPAGLRGLVFAGLFAAAVSSLGATLNATAAIWTSDIRPIAIGGASEGAAGLRRARRLNVVFGFLLALVGLFFAWYASGSVDYLVQIALGSMTIIYGGLLGGFLCALLYRQRGSDLSVPLGMAAGCALGAVLFFQKELFSLAEKRIEWPWFIPICATLTLAIGAIGRRDAAEARA